MSKNNVKKCSPHELVSQVLVKNWDISLEEARKTAMHDFRLILNNISGSDLKHLTETEYSDMMIQLLTIYCNTKLYTMKKEDSIYSTYVESLDMIYIRINSMLDEDEFTFEEFKSEYVKAFTMAIEDYKNFGIKLDDIYKYICLHNNVCVYIDTKLSFKHGVPSGFKLTIDAEGAVRVTISV